MPSADNLYCPFQPTLTRQGLDQLGLAFEQSLPCAVLRGKVHSCLQIRAQHPTPYPIIPDGAQAVYIAPSGSLIGGAFVKSGQIQILQPGEYFGIRFCPGALRHFFNLNVAEITGQFADSQFFPCRAFQQLHEQIFSKDTYRERAQVCEAWLLKNYMPAPAGRLDQALQRIYRTAGDVKISQLADDVGCSERHLNRHFLNSVGIGAKKFAQIIRIQTVCKRLYATPDAGVRAALDAGYYDQAHLIKDFKNTLSVSPGVFFERLMSGFYNQ